MKRIVLNSRVIFHLRKDGKVFQTFTFEKGKPYEVEDAVAENAFIAERLASAEPVKKESQKKGKGGKTSAVDEKEAEEKEAEHDKSASDD